MFNDVTRNQAYKLALEEAVKPGAAFQEPSSEVIVLLCSEILYLFKYIHGWHSCSKPFKLGPSIVSKEAVYQQEVLAEPVRSLGWSCLPGNRFCIMGTLHMPRT